MLPGESGQALVERLTADPALRGSARVAVFSAGLTPEVRDRLGALGVWRLLSKPVSLAELEGCVREAIGSAAGEARTCPTPAPAPAPPAAGRASHRPDGDPGGLPRPPAQPGAPAAARAERRAAAVHTHFGGDAELFDTYLASCRQQFPADCRTGDRALAAADWPALRRLAHSLKTVLLTLGEPAAGAQAATLEAACARSDTAAATELWPALRAQLQQLSSEPA